MSDNIVSDSWPSWKYVAAAAIPITVCGAGAYYLYSIRKNNTLKAKQINPPERFDPEGSSSPQRNNEVVNPKVEESPKKSKLEESQDLKNQGNRMFKQGSYEEAIKLYSEAISVCPDKHTTEKSTYHQNKAAALEKMENWQGVIDECTAAISLNQRYVKALFRRSRSFEKLGRKEDCLEDITTVCILEGFQNANSMVYADEILKQIGKEKAAKKYKNRRHVMPSSVFIEQYFASFTDDVISAELTQEQKEQAADSGYIRARIAIGKQQFSDVVGACTQEIDPTAGEPSEVGDMQQRETDKKTYLAEALLLRGTFYLLMGNSEAAKEDLERLIAMENINVKLTANALIKRGSMNMQLQKSDQAVEDFTKAITIDPENCDVFHHRGQLNILLDKVGDALADFDKCIELKPDFAMAHAQKCYTVYRQAYSTKDVVRTQAAIAQFEEIIKKFPRCSETYGLYAQAQTDTGNYEKADQLFKDSIEIEPENATLYVHRGLLALQWKQDVDGAVKLISNALEVDNKCDFAHETMGTIEVQRGNLEKAIEHFLVAIDYAKSELEMAHLYALQAAALAQGNIARKYGLRPPLPPM